MTQLRIARVNLKIVSRNSNGSFRNSRKYPDNWSVLPPLVQKAMRLHNVRPKAAAVVEKLVDRLLDEFNEQE